MSEINKLSQMMGAKLMVFLMERARSGRFGWEEWLAENGMTTDPQNTEDYFAVTINTTLSFETKWSGVKTLYVPKEFAMKVLVLGFMP